MTPEQEQMFNIRSSPQPMNMPTHSVQAGGEMDDVEGMEIINHGLALGMQYMAGNGPTQARHSIQDRARGLDQNKITKQQLEEQRMNEAKGLPSNLEEAGRVVDLEQKVSQINDNINKLTGVMTQLIQSQQTQSAPQIKGQPGEEFYMGGDGTLRPTPKLGFKPTPTDLSQPPRTKAPGSVGQPPTPQVKPVAGPPLLGRNLTSVEKNIQQLKALDLPTDGPTTQDGTQESVPDSSQPVTPPPVSQETPTQPTDEERTVPDPNEIPEKYYDAVEIGGKVIHTERTETPIKEEVQRRVEGLQEEVDTIILQEADMISPTPNMALGPVGTPGPQFENRYTQFLLDNDIQLADESSPGSDVSVLVEEEAPQVDPVEQKRLERQQILTDQVTDWLKSKDGHKFWRQFIAGACNKNLSYNTWPKEFQNSFNERFSTMIADPIFVSSLCGKVIKFQNGHLVAAHVMGAFIVATAGFLAFALIEV